MYRNEYTYLYFIYVGVLFGVASALLFEEL